MSLRNMDFKVQQYCVTPSVLRLHRTVGCRVLPPAHRFFIHIVDQWSPVPPVSAQGQSANIYITLESLGVAHLDDSKAFRSYVSSREACGYWTVSCSQASTKAQFATAHQA